MKIEQTVTITLLLAMTCLAEIEVSIDEEVSPGTEVTRLQSHRSVFRNLSDDQIMAMTYAILGQNSPPASYFKIDPNTGVVTVASRIDREEVCDPVEICSVKVNIAIQAGSQAHVTFSTVVTLDVLINDINDNPPRFPARDVTLEIQEGAKVRTELKISGAVDRDSKREFTVQHYNITPTISTFSLTSSINLDGSSTISLRLERELDRELTDEYSFKIVAYDGGAHPQSDYLSMTVKVLDDNDNIPRFDRSRYDMVVNTNQQIGARVGQVNATDADAGNNGRLTYNFSSSSEAAIKGVFTINSSTGWITLTGDLRTIRRSSPLQIFVIASDNGEPVLSSQAVVSLLIINSENMAPFVKVKTVAAEDVSTLTIPESAALDDFVAFIDVEDNDDGENGKVFCQILSGFEFKLSALPNKDYTLLLNTSVDRERKDSYKIIVSCKDEGTPPLETQVSLTVNITDVNDNTPKFSNNLYVGSVDENRDAGQFIIQVLAHDSDVGANAEIVYSLEKDARDFIKIHAKTGVISTSAPLDREKNSTLRFKVFATDSGDRPRTGVTEISIIVKDVNDNNPFFNQSQLSFSVSEQAQNGTVVGILDGFDLDINANGQFDFYFGGSANGDLPLPFSVFKNGSITVTGQLDRETKEKYIFTALVRDRGDIPRSSTAPVEIKILDENDNDPVILFPTSKNHTIIISSFPENGMVLGRIIAYDMDEGDAAELRYFLYDGDTDKAFSMGVTNGELVIQSVERLQNNKEYYLSIKVEDATANPRNATTQLKVQALFDNTTRAGAISKGDGARDQYVIIVGVIGGATVVLSAIIISAIFVILRSERNRHATANERFLKKTKTLSGVNSQGVPVETRVDNLDSAKSQSCSSVGSDPQGMIIGPGALNKKHDDVLKKVSFSLRDDQVHPNQVHLPEKQFRLNLHNNSDGSTQWKQLGSPDDISSDTSGESGISDSGRGTSDEDIKFDYLQNRGPSRLGDPFHQVRDRSFDQISFSNSSNNRSNSGFHEQENPRPHTTSTPLLHPGHPHFLESERSRVPASRTISLNRPQQYPLSSFVPGASSSQRPTNPRLYNLCKDESSNFNPIHSNNMAYKQQQDSFVSNDDDLSTTTSGSYVISHDDITLESFTNLDVVV